MDMLVDRGDIYRFLAKLTREALAERRVQLQGEINRIDQLCGPASTATAEEVVRQGTSREVPIVIGEAHVWATEEQPDAFMLQIGPWERRCQPDDLLPVIVGRR